MRKRLDDKVAIVTGAGSSDEGVGTGDAAAILFAREGARVVLVDSSPERAKRTHGVIAAEGGEAMTVTADVTVASDCERVVSTVLDAYGQLDILDNNIGVGIRGDVVSVNESDWDFIMAINVKSIMLMSKYAVPAMLMSKYAVPAIERSETGAIINISSIATRRPSHITPYSASKGAVEALTRAMATDHGGQGIRVNCIAPGFLATPRGTHLDPKMRERRREVPVVNHEGNAWDVAYGAVYLASDEAAYVSGIVLQIDGGASVRGFDLSSTT